MRYLSITLPLASLIALCSACDSSSEDYPSDDLEILDNDSILIEEDSSFQESSSNDYFGMKVKPSNEHEITEGGIGNVNLGDSMIWIDKLFDEVDDIEISSEGASWPAKKIWLNDDQWVLAEATSMPGIIGRMSTNGNQFKTKLGIHLGMKLYEVLDLTENVHVHIYEGFMSLRISDENISAVIDSLSRKDFNEREGFFLEDVDTNATLIEFGIY